MVVDGGGATREVSGVNQPEFKQHVEALYSELVRYARRRLIRLHASADRAADVAHTAIVDLVERGGYERCVTQDEVLAVLRTAIKHDAIDALRDPDRRHRSLHSLRDRWADHDEDGSNGVAPERPSAATLAVRMEDTLITALDVRRAIEAEALTTPKRAVFLFVMHAEDAFVEISWQDARRYYEQQDPGNGHLIIQTMKPLVERVHASLRQRLVDYDYKDVGPRTQEQIDAAEVAFLRRWAAYIRAEFRRDLRRCRRFFA